MENGSSDFEIFIKFEKQIVRSRFLSADAGKVYVLSGLSRAWQIMLKKRESCNSVDSLIVDSLILMDDLFNYLNELRTMLRHENFSDAQLATHAREFLYPISWSATNLDRTAMRAKGLEAKIKQEMRRCRRHRLYSFLACFFIFVALAWMLYSLFSSGVVKIVALVIGFPFAVTWRLANDSMKAQLDELKKQADVAACIRNTAIVVGKATRSHILDFIFEFMELI